MTWMALLACLVCIACGEGAAPSPAPVVIPPAAKRAPKATPPAKKVRSAVHVYSPLGKRDPFRSIYFVEGAAQAEEDVDEDVCTEPLCQYHLNELTLVAVISGAAQPLAMLQDKAGIGHMVKRNTKVGKSGGKVSRILRDCIVVTMYISGEGNDVQATQETMCVNAGKHSDAVLDLFRGENIP